MPVVRSFWSAAFCAEPVFDGPQVLHAIDAFPLGGLAALFFQLGRGLLEDILRAAEFQLPLHLFALTAEFLVPFVDARDVGVVFFSRDTEKLADRAGGFVPEGFHFAGEFAKRFPEVERGGVLLFQVFGDGSAAPGLGELGRGQGARVLELLEALPETL